MYIEDLEDDDYSCRSCGADLAAGSVGSKYGEVCWPCGEALGILDSKEIEENKNWIDEVAKTSRWPYLKKD